MSAGTRVSLKIKNIFEKPSHWAQPLWLPEVLNQGRTVASALVRAGALTYISAHPFDDVEVYSSYRIGHKNIQTQGVLIKITNTTKVANRLWSLEKGPEIGCW